MDKCPHIYLRTETFISRVLSKNEQMSTHIFDYENVRFTCNPKTEQLFPPSVLLFSATNWISVVLTIGHPWGSLRMFLLYIPRRRIRSLLHLNVPYSTGTIMRVKTPRGRPTLVHKTASTLVDVGRTSPERYLYYPDSAPPNALVRGHEPYARHSKQYDSLTESICTR